MIITEQRIIENVRIIPPRINVLQFRVNSDSKLKGIDIYTSAPLSGFGFLYLGVRINGVSLFSTYPDDYINIPNGSDHGSVTGLNIDVVRGDIISLDVLGNARRNLGAFLTFMAHLDDGQSGVPAGGDADQILTKVSGSDGDVAWADPPAGGGAGNVADVPYLAPSAFDDEFDAGSLDAKWITNLSNSPPIDHFLMPGILSLEPVGGGAAQAIMQVTTDVDQTFRMKVSGHPKSSGNANSIGFAVRSGSNRWDTFCFDVGNRYFRQFQCFNPNAVFQQNNLADYGSILGASGLVPQIWQEIEYKTSGKTLKYRYSIDGIEFQEIDSRTTILGDPITHIGIHCQGNSGVANNYAHVDWFRKLQGSYTGGM